MSDIPAIPDYIHDAIVFYDAYRGLCLVGNWGDDGYWLFTSINGAWVSSRRLTVDEIQNLDTLRAKEVRNG